MSFSVLARSFSLRSGLPSCSSSSVGPRPFATVRPSQLPSDATPPRIYVSESTSPYFNLAFEDWLFRKTPPALPMLFMYRNDASVIIGRNQNPFKETNIPLMKKRDIAFVRRRSGGGTVYHDLGNTNYAVMMPKDQFERRPNAELVARALNSLGVEAVVNERHDITLGGAKMIRIFLTSYISGSAFKLNNRRAYHHGTMLIDAKLDQLGEVLKSHRVFTSNLGTDSVRSSVTNISSSNPSITHSSYVDAVVGEFVKTYKLEGAEVQPMLVSPQRLEDTTVGEEVAKEAEDLQAWEWAFGQTPEFEVQVERDLPGLGHVKARIKSKHGIITEAEIKTPKELGIDQDKLSKVFVGQRFAESVRIGREESLSMRGVAALLCKTM